MSEIIAKALPIFWRPRQSLRRQNSGAVVNATSEKKKPAVKKEKKKPCLRCSCSLGGCSDTKVLMGPALMHFSMHQLKGDNDSEICAYCGKDHDAPTSNSTGKKWIFPESCVFAGNTLNVKKLKKIEVSFPLANYPMSCPHCEKSLRDVLKSAMFRQLSEFWSSLPGSACTHEICSKWEPRFLTPYNVSRRTESFYYRLAFTQNDLKPFLHSIHRATEDTCRACCSATETATHIFSHVLTISPNKSDL